MIAGSLWAFPKIRVLQNGWFTMENLIKMDDLGVPLFLETSISKTNRYFNGRQGRFVVFGVNSLTPP